MLTNSEKLAKDTVSKIARQLAILLTASAAAQSWADYSEVIVCDSCEEMLQQADEMASQHVLMELPFWPEGCNCTAVPAGRAAIGSGSSRWRGFGHRQGS